ncbi:type II secretion system GspH family protein [Candidatus Microgenomates bacterium]|nr:type II secretion system GspH family protein [Candidatus Microgenomates bacterium]
MSRNPRLSGFTLMELLIVMTLVAILAGMALMTNVKSSLQKSRDSKRKQDLNKMVRIFEDYYNDHQHYPPADSATGIIQEAAWGQPFSTYVPLLPKDPVAPSQNYYYMTDDALFDFYVLYARLENTADPDIVTVGCEGGCGPNRSYNYVVHSADIVMLAGNPSRTVDSGGEGGGGGGDGGGGGGASVTPSVSPTAGPSLTVTPFLTPATPPGATCDYNQCCASGWCGGPPGVGVQCPWLDKCFFDPIYGIWDCQCSSMCGAFWCAP